MLNVDTILKKAKLSKQDLAKRMGVSRENLYRILNGNPTLQNIEKVAEALDVQVWELFSDPSRPHQNDLNGFVEYQGTIYRISTVDDLEKLLELVTRNNVK